jgi:hypothetical protein
MNRPDLKSADAPVVDDPAAAMQRTIEVTRKALAVPKAKIDAALAKEKTGRHKRK